ncbi:MAG: PaaI family thioesterase [Aeromicrobium sp.]
MTEIPDHEPGLNEYLGLRYSEIGPDRVVIEWTIGPEHLQPWGIPHGGSYCTVHEAAGSIAGVEWINRDRAPGKPQVPVVGTNNSTDFLRQAKPGDIITTTATPIHRGRTQQLWRVESVDQDGRLIAQGQMRLANLPTS